MRCRFFYIPLYPMKTSLVNESQWSENITVDLTTGIASFEMSPGMEDGNLPSAGYFSLLGQHVAVPSQRGIYIRNGRKVVVK